MELNCQTHDSKIFAVEDLDLRPDFLEFWLSFWASNFMYLHIGVLHWKMGILIMSTKLNFEDHKGYCV